MAKARPQSEGPTLGREIAAVGGICLAIFLLLCLASYSAPLHQASLFAARGAANWCGTVGDFTARALLSFLGISAFWLIGLLLFFSFQLFSPHLSFSRLPAICAGCTGLLLASSGLTATFWYRADGTIGLLGRHYPAGGHIGRLLSTLLQAYFGTAGSVLLLLTIFLFSLMGAVRFSPYFAGRELLRRCGRLGDLSCRPGGRAERQTLPAGARAVVAPLEEGPPIETGVVPDVYQPVRVPDLAGQEEEEDFQVLPVSSDHYRLPGLGLLDKVENQAGVVDREHYYKVSGQLEQKLKDFGVLGKVVGISPGPVVTTYEFAPAPGVKINRITALADDLAMGLKAESVRITGSIPGKAALGIEIPNPVREIVYLRDMLASDVFRDATSKLTLALGMDVVGQPVVADLAKMPHLLIAGATGAGKSVAINSIICSILFKATPDEVRMLMVDPKRIELSGYEAIPHLLHPVVVDARQASRALMWAVREMERRYQLMEQERVKSFSGYNEVAEEKLPLIVIIVDELADLMMVSSRDVEDAIARLAQMARAAGMHLILATQRPSVDVLTGLIKANFPTRISFKVASKIDSRTILDGSGAEHLLGAGDLLFLAPGTARLQRLHGAYLSESETARIVTFLKEQGTARYDESALVIAEEGADEEEGFEGEVHDPKYDEAVALVCETGQASISMVQRRLRVGYNRAARMIEIMEKEGVVGPADGAKSREVLVRKEY